MLSSLHKRTASQPKLTSADSLPSPPLSSFAIAVYNSIFFSCHTPSNYASIPRPRLHQITITIITTPTESIRQLHLNPNTQTQAQTIQISQPKVLVLVTFDPGFSNARGKNVLKPSKPPSRKLHGRAQLHSTQNVTNPDTESIHIQPRRHHSQNTQPSWIEECHTWISRKAASSACNRELTSPAALNRWSYFLPKASI